MAVIPRVENASLVGNKVDTHIVGLDTNLSVKFLFGPSSKKVSGIIKVGNVFLKKLFTLRGSNPLSIYEGTDFPTLVGSNISDEESTTMVVQNAIKDAEEQVIQDQAAQDLPEDEMLASVTLVYLNFITEERLDVSVDLITAAGRRAVIKLPQVDLQ